MKFSVVIPTKDRLTDLQKCIQSLISQTMRPKEIIIIDGSSTKIIEEYFKILSKEIDDKKYYKVIQVFSSNM